MAIPIPPGTPGIGPTAEGTDRYLAGLGLMHELPLQFLGGGGMEALSMMTPLIKGPLEGIMGQSFFQRGPMGGRALQDMDPLVGRTISNVMQMMAGDTGRREPARWPGATTEHIAANLPISPHLTYLRTMTDPRKGMAVKAFNLLTGLRFADVSPEAKRALLDETLQAMIRSKAGARVFAKPYIPKSALAEMSPEEREAAMRLTALQNMLSRTAREEAKKRAGR